MSPKRTWGVGDKYGNQGQVIDLKELHRLAQSKIIGQVSFSTQGVKHGKHIEAIRGLPTIWLSR